MWGSWKDKLGKLFSDNEPNNHQEIDQKNRNLNVKAKMTYQYPKEKPFRFPVIPDQHSAQPEHKQVADKPAYERRKPDTKQTKPTGNRKIEDTSKIYKKKQNTPFKPTEVPSPIYGFQPRRNRNEIENVPAYKRKREKHQEFAEEIKTEDGEEGIQQTAAMFSPDKYENNQEYLNIQQDPSVSEETTEQEVEAGWAGSESGIPNTDNKLNAVDNFSTKTETGKFITESSMTNTGDEVQNPEESISAKPRQTSEQENKAMPVRERKDSSRSESITDSQQKSIKNQSKENPVTYRKHSQKDKRNQQEKNKVPFNVMMTPADKKRQLEREKQVKDTSIEMKRFKRVPYHLLDDKEESTNEDHRWIRQQRELLEETLKHFNVRARVVNATQGPTVTRFEVQPEMGVKVSKVKNLSDDLKLNMAAKDIRIEAPIPGKRTIGIEIPNKKAQKVGLQGIFETDAFKNSDSPLSIALGLDIEGTPLITNIQKMPHGLIAGATGSGKSVCINTILVSLLYKANYEDVKFLLIDPKMVELAPYNGIPHLVSPVITDVKAATQALKWAVREMEERYEKFVEEGVRDIERFNQKIAGQGRQDEKMPFIVIVIDELADLMMVAPQDVEDAISRIAQKARACGIHLLLATQRPSVDVITGLIKANIPTRIAFSVSSQVDSRTILDTAGAEKLLGKGDMLFIENGTGKSTRLQGPFVSDEEIERVSGYARTLAEPNYLFEQEDLLKEVSTEETEDELLQDVIHFVLNQQGASTSLLQRHYKIGYNRAARLIDTLENKGIISGQNGSKPREILVTQTQLQEGY
ncbi:DNA translocase FtsK [Virgibacillus oceani]